MIDSSNFALSDLGLVEYKEAWEIQKKLQKERIQGQIEDTLIVCQHYPVVTLGRSANRKENILFDESDTDSLPVFEVERGGDVTLHNPGQLVLYPIMDLGSKRKDVGWYMRSLEAVVINCLLNFQISSTGIKGKTGVWTLDTNDSLNTSARKIASIGVRISRWVTMHGLSLNISNNLHDFRQINPCGLKGVEITSVYKELEQKQKLCSTVTDFPTIIRVKELLIESFCEVFNYKPIIKDATDDRHYVNAL